MEAAGWVGWMGGLCVILTGALAHAECTKDTDCKGDRVCTAGACVAPKTKATLPAAPGSVSPPPQGTASQRPIGFSNLVVRLEHSDEIGIAGEDFRIHILEALRRQGLNAVGAENLVFGSDAGGAAELLLGGTVSELDCKPGAREDLVSCWMGVEWQVLDRSSDSVVYRVTTRGLVRDMAKKPSSGAGRKLVYANLESLSARPRFRRLLLPEATPNTASASGYSAASLRGCEVAARKMPGASEQVLDSTVLIQTTTGFGSGFVASSDGFVLTAAHVVSGTAATVRLRDGRELPATLIRNDRRLDIALLRLAVPQGVTLPCLPMKLEDAAVGSDAYAIGTPTRRELSFSLARGIVSGVRVLDGVQYIQTDAAVNRGNSGGPLVDASGEAFGIVSAKLVGTGVEGIAFGVPLRAGLNAIGVRPTDATSGDLMTGSAPATEHAPIALVDQADPMPDLAGAAAIDHTAPQKRRSLGMMTGGIVMLSSSPVAILVAGVASGRKRDCEANGGGSSNYDCGNYDAAIYGGLLTAVALVGIGIPLTVIGGAKVPVSQTQATVRITPWAAPHTGGLVLGVDL